MLAKAFARCAACAKSSHGSLQGKAPNFRMAERRKRQRRDFLPTGRLGESKAICIIRRTACTLIGMDFQHELVKNAGPMLDKIHDARAGVAREWIIHVSGTVHESGTLLKRDLSADCQKKQVARLQKVCSFLAACLDFL